MLFLVGPQNQLSGMIVTPQAGMRHPRHVPLHAIQQLGRMLNCVGKRSHEWTTEGAPPGRVENRGWPWWDEEALIDPKLWRFCLGLPGALPCQVPGRRLSPARGGFSASPSPDL